MLAVGLELRRWTLKTFILNTLIVLGQVAFSECAIAAERDPGFAFGYQITGGPTITTGEAGTGTVAGGSAEVMFGGKLRNDWNIGGVFGTQTYQVMPDSTFVNDVGNHWHADGFSVLFRGGKTFDRFNVWLEGGLSSVETNNRIHVEYADSRHATASYSVAGLGASYELISRPSFSFEFTASLRHMNSDDSIGARQIGDQMLVQNYGLAMNFYPQPSSYSSHHVGTHIHCYVGCFDIPLRILVEGGAHLLPEIGAALTQAVFRLR
jgi:hypothetical protein